MIGGTEESDLLHPKNTKLHHRSLQALPAPFRTSVVSYHGQVPVLRRQQVPARIQVLPMSGPEIKNLCTSPGIAKQHLE